MKILRAVRLPTGEDVAAQEAAWGRRSVSTALEGASTADLHRFSLGTTCGTEQNEWIFRL